MLRNPFSQAKWMKFFRLIFMIWWKETLMRSVLEKDILIKAFYLTLCS